MVGVVDGLTDFEYEGAYVMSVVGGLVDCGCAIDDNRTN